MGEKKSVDEKIADELGVELHETEIQKHEPTEIVQSTEHADQDQQNTHGDEGPGARHHEVTDAEHLLHVACRSSLYSRLV